MATESFLGVMCAGLISLGFGLLLAFAGYRLFLVLLPIFGFFFGFFLGAQAIQALLGEAFLGTVTSWVVGFIVGAIFAVLSYMFYMAAVAVIAGGLGYAAGVGLLTWIGMDFGLIVWIIAVLAGIALAVVTLLFNLQKWVIMIATAILGAAVVVTTFAFMFNPWDTTLANPIKTAMDTSPLVIIVFIVLAICGFVVQYQVGKAYQIEDYNNWSY